MIESWHSTVEFELRRLEHFATQAQARVAVAADTHGLIQVRSGRRRPWRRLA